MNEEQESEQEQEQEQDPLQMLLSKFEAVERRLAALEHAVHSIPKTQGIFTAGDEVERLFAKADEIADALQNQDRELTEAEKRKLDE